MPTQDEMREGFLRVISALEDLVAEVARGGGSRDDVARIRAEITRAEVAAFGPRPRSRRGEGAKHRILAYLLDHVGEWVSADELAELAGIKAWARRVRELRVEDGWPIKYSAGAYRLDADTPETDKAEAWRAANAIRRQTGSAASRVQALFEASVGVVVTRDQLDYVARIKEGTRRVRELRDEEGWPINSHADEQGLRPGEYRLLSTAIEDRLDPAQRDYPEKLRHAVFLRDGFTCQECQRDQSAARAAGDTRFYLEVHHVVAVADELARLPQRERHDMENLVTLCHACHREATAALQRRKRETRS